MDKNKISLGLAMLVTGFLISHYATSSRTYQLELVKNISANQNNITSNLKKLGETVREHDKQIYKLEILREAEHGKD